MTAKRIDGQAVNGVRKPLSEAIPLDIPYSVSVFPFYGCNFKCSYCIHSMPLNERFFVSDIQKMELTTFETFCDGFLSSTQKIGRLKALHFAGSGEPLLHPQLPDMVRYAKEKDIAGVVDVVSNGAMLTESLFIALRDAGLDKLRISLQGLDTASYRSMAGVMIDFDDFYKNLQCLSKDKGKMKIYVKILDKALGKHTEEEFISLFGDIADDIAVERLCPFVADIDYEEKFRQTDFELTMNTNRVQAANVCPQPFYMLDLYPNGDMVPCCNFERPLTVGNVLEQDVYTIFHGETLKNFCKLQLSGKKAENNACRRCTLYRYQMFPEDYLDDKASELLPLFC